MTFLGVVAAAKSDMAHLCISACSERGICMQIEQPGIRHVLQFSVTDLAQSV